MAGTHYILLRSRAPEIHFLQRALEHAGDARSCEAAAVLRQRRAERVQSERTFGQQEGLDDMASDVCTPWHIVVDLRCITGDAGANCGTEMTRSATYDA